MPDPRPVPDRLRVLCVDGEPADRALALRLLGSEFPEIDGTEISGISELETALGAPCDLVVTDYELAATTGLEILRAVRDRRPATPVIMFTGSGTEEVAVDAMRAGLDDYVIKDRDHATRLGTAARGALERRRHAQALEAAEDRLRVLASASAAVHDTLDARSALARLTAACVPDQAAGAIAWLAGPDDSVETVVVAGGDDLRTVIERFADGLRRNPPDHGVLRPSETRLSNDGDSFLAEAASNPWQRSLFKALGAQCVMVVPIIARRERMGALLLFLTDPEVCFGEGDQALAEELAKRTGVAIDHARLYHAAVAGTEAKSQFLATMSHELRTPLQGVLGYAALMEEGLTGYISDTQRRAIGRIRGAVQHLVHLVDEILLYSKAESGWQEIDATEVDLVSLCREEVEALREEAERKGLGLTVEARGPITVRTDGTKVQQILHHLIGNAIKFTEEGSVEVTVEPTEGHEVVVLIQDTGPGIDRSEFERVFEPFYQIDGSTTRQQGGTGLGLAVSRRLARVLGGDVRIHDDARVGSTFQFSLPAEMAPTG